MNAIYSITDLETFTGISRPKIRHWVRGDKRTGNFGRLPVGPIIEPRYGLVEGQYMLDFLNLIEIIVIDKLREAGLSVHRIRRMRDYYKKEFNTPYPFATEEMWHDTKTIVLRYVEKEETGLINLDKGQYELEGITDVASRKIDLQKELKRIHFDPVTKLADLWWPWERNKPVIIKPDVRSGQPIIEETGYPTILIANSVLGEGDPAIVSDLYGVEEWKVREAYIYETQITQRLKLAA